MSCIVLSYLSAAHIAACSHLTRTETLKSSSLGIRCIQERNSCVPVTGAAVFYNYRSEFWDFVAHYIDPVLFQLSLDQYGSTFAMFTIIPHSLRLSWAVKIFTDPSKCCHCNAWRDEAASKKWDSLFVWDPFAGSSMEENEKAGRRYRTKAKVKMLPRFTIRCLSESTLLYRPSKHHLFSAAQASSTYQHLSLLEVCTSISIVDDGTIERCIL